MLLGVTHSNAEGVYNNLYDTDNNHVCFILAIRLSCSDVDGPIRVHDDMSCLFSLVK